MNVLHVVDPGAVDCGALTLRYVADLILERGANDGVIVLGNRGDARLAQRCGLRVDALAPFPALLPFGPSRGVREIVRGVAKAHGAPALVHAWSLRAEALAAQIAPNQPCVVSGMVGPELERTLPARIAAQFAPVMHSRSAELRFVVPHPAVRRELSGAGILEEKAWVVEPGVDMALLAPHRQPTRVTLRRKWGVDDDTLLVGLISQPVEWGNARAAASIVTLPVTAHRNVKLLVHPEAARLRDAYEWARPLDLDGRLIQDADLAEPWRVVAGLDVALWIGNPQTVHEGEFALEQPQLRFGRLPLPGVLPMLWAMAAGLPVLAERCAVTNSIILDGENGILIEPYDVTAGAMHMIALADDAELRRKLGATAKLDIESRFTIAHAARRMNDAYSRLLDGLRQTPVQRDVDEPIAVRLPSSASAAST